MELKGELHSYAPVVPSKTTPDSRPKSAKCIPVFTPKRPQNPTLWGSAYLYGLYKGVPPCPSSRVDRFLLTSPSQKLKRSWKGLQFRIPGWRPGGPVPLIFRPNGGTKGRKKFCGDRPATPPPPHHLISRSGFGNGLFGRHYTWILIITSCEQRAKCPPQPLPPPYSVLFSPFHYLPEADLGVPEAVGSKSAIVW